MGKTLNNTEGISYLRKEEFSDVAGEDSKKSSERLAHFSSGINGLKNLNTKLQKINALKGKSSQVDILSILNSISLKGITTHNSDSPEVHAYFSKQGDDIILVVNNIVNGKDRGNSKDAMENLLRKIDEHLDEQKISNSLGQEKNPDKIIHAHQTRIFSYRQALQKTQETYKENTNVVSSVFDIRNSISRIYRDSFEVTKNNIRVSYEAFLKEYTVLKGTHDLSPEQTRNFERIKKMFETTLAQTFEIQSLASSVEKTGVIQFGESLTEDFIDGTLKRYAIAGVEGELKGMYNATLGIAELIFKLSTDEQVREAMGQSLGKMWKYISTNCTEPGKVWGDFMKALSKELEKVKNLPPEQQAHAIGDIFGNIVGTMALGGGAMGVKKWLLTTAKLPKGVNVITKILECKKIQKWADLEKYVDDIGTDKLSSEALKTLIKGVQDGSVKLSDLPKDLGIRDKAMELLKYGGEIPEAKGILNKVVSKGIDTSLKGTEKAARSMNKARKALNESPSGRLTANISSETIAYITVTISNIEKTLGILEKIEKILVATSGTYGKTKGAIGATGEGYSREMTLKTLHHFEETLATLGENIKTLFENIQKDPRILATTSRSITYTIDNAKYLLERCIKDPLFADITEGGSLIAPMKKQIQSLSEIIKRFIPETTKEILKYSEGMAKIEVQVNGKTLVGFKDHTGKVIIEPTYETAKDFENGYAIVSRNGIIDIINKKGVNSGLNIEIKNIKDIRITEDGMAIIERKDGKVNSIGIFDMKSGKYTLEPSENYTTYNLGYAKKPGLLVKDEKDLWRLITNDNRLADVRLKNKPEKIGENCSVAEDANGWRIITDNGELIETTFKNKPEKVGLGFIAIDANGWRIITGDGKVITETFKNKPERLGSYYFTVEDASGWRIITGDGKVIERSFKNEPEILGLNSFIAEDTNGWRIITRMGEVSKESFKNRLEGFGEGFITKNTNGEWQVINSDGVVIKYGFKNKPEEMEWGGFIAEDESGWRIITRMGEVSKESFKGKPEDLGRGFITEDVNGWRIIASDGELLENNFKGRPEYIEEAASFIAEDTSGWKIITFDGKLLDGSFKNKPEHVGYGFIAEDTSGWRMSSIDGRLVEGNFKNKPERISEDSDYFIAEDASGWRIITQDGELVKTSFKTKPEEVGRGFIAEDASGWRIITQDGKLVDGSFKNKPRYIFYGFIIEKNGGKQFITNEGNIIPGIYENIRMRTYEGNGGIIERKAFGENKYEPININLLKSNTNTTSLQNNDLLYTAAFVGENIGSINRSAKRIRRDLDVTSTHYIGEESANIIPVLNKDTHLEDFFVGLRADNKKMSTSFQSLVNEFSEIRNTTILRGKVSTVIDEGVQIYIQNINARRDILNISRKASGQKLLPKLSKSESEFEVAYLEHTYKARMEREFMQAIQQEIAIQEGKLSVMSPVLGNQDNLRNIIGQFISKDTNSELYASIGGETARLERVEPVKKTGTR